MTVLQLRKLSLGEVKQLAQGHTTSRWQRTKKTGLPEFEAFTLNQYDVLPPKR